MYIPDVPCLVDITTPSGVLMQAKCAVVIYNIYLIWPLKSRLTIFAVLVLFYHNRIILLYKYMEFGECFLAHYFYG